MSVNSGRKNNNAGLTSFKVPRSPPKSPIRVETNMVRRNGISTKGSSPNSIKRNSKLSSPTNPLTLTKNRPEHQDPSNASNVEHCVTSQGSVRPRTASTASEQSNSDTISIPKATSDPVRDGVNTLFSLDAQVRRDKALIEALKVENHKLESRYLTLQQIHDALLSKSQGLDEKVRSAEAERDVLQSIAEQRLEKINTLELDLHKRKTNDEKAIAYDKSCHQERNELQVKLGKLQKDYDSIKKEEGRLRKSHEALKSGSTRLETDFKDIQSRFDTANTEIDSLKTELAKSLEASKKYEHGNNQLRSFLADAKLAIESLISPDQHASDEILEAAQTQMQTAMNWMKAAQAGNSERNRGIRKVLDMGKSKMLPLGRSPSPSRQCLIDLENGDVIDDDGTVRGHTIVVYQKDEEPATPPAVSRSVLPTPAHTPPATSKRSICRVGDGGGTDEDSIGSAAKRVKRRDVYDVELPNGFLSGSDKVV